MVVLGGGALTYERGTPVKELRKRQGKRSYLWHRFKTKRTADHSMVRREQRVQGYLADKKLPPPTILQ